MSLADQQRFLARVCTDPRIRERFCTERAQVAAELQLAAEDQAWCDGLSEAELTGFATSLRRKRFQEIRKLLPVTTRLLDLEFGHELWRRFSVQDQDATSDPDAVRMAIRLADFLLASAELTGRTAQRGSAWAAPIRDVVRYEQARLQAIRARWLVRWFRYPVGEIRARLAEPWPEKPRITIGIWVRVWRRGCQWHRLFSLARA